MLRRRQTAGAAPRRQFDSVVERDKAKTLRSALRAMFCRAMEFVAEGVQSAHSRR